MEEKILKEKFSVTGMSCSACAAGIERTLQSVDGILSTNVSLMGEMMTVEYDEKKIQRESIIQKVIELGYGASIFDENALKQRKPQPDALKKRFLLSLCFLLPLAYFSMGGMFSLPQPNAKIGATLQAILTFAILLINFNFFTSGGKALLKGVSNMDTLVALGAGTAFVCSLIYTVFLYIDKLWPGAYLFYDSAAMILTLVTLGKWLEEKSKRKTGDEVEKLIQLMPNVITVERNGVLQKIPFSEIQKGEIFIVKQGEYIPVDGKIIEGQAFIDRAAITGESMPIEAQIGDKVTSADIVKSGFIRVIAEKVGMETTLSQIVKMVKEAGASKAPIQKFADKVAGIFVPAVTLIAISTFAIWWWISKDVTLAINYAISVLVISCPCSLGLATPVAVMASTGRAMSLGILFKDAESLQKAKEINCVLLDKTATLTIGKPRVTNFEYFDENQEEILRLALSMERRSNHPIAECIVAFAHERGIEESVEIEEYEYLLGKGGTCRYKLKNYLLGNRRLLGERAQEKARALEKKYSEEGKTPIFFANDDKILAVFAVADILKAESKFAIEDLKKRNIRVAMLTGDNENVASSIAKEVGIEEFFAECLPENKANTVKNVKEMGGFVAMIGDGINDSPALKEADIGVAMGNGTDVAIDTADVVLSRGDLRLVGKMIDLSKTTVRIIKENLFWAFFYNCLAIPLAAGLFAFANISLTPMIGSICMCLSSLFVVTNALRLTNFDKKKVENKVKMENVQIETVKTESEATEMKKKMYIEGMMCQHCVRHVTKALEGVEGVENIEVNLEEKTATFTLASPVSNEKLTEVIVDAGYEVTSIE